MQKTIINLSYLIQIVHNYNCRQMSNMWAGETHPGKHIVSLLSVMSFIENITKAPIVRDNTTLDISQYRLAYANPIDSAISCLLGSITYDRKHSFNLE